MILSAVVLVIVSPLLLAAVIGVRLSSPGPLLYKASRVGRDGQIFTMYKVRTMHLEREQSSSTITGKNDVRVFPFGSLLRYLKIDELPQLLNIVKGEMSIVGPRPEDPYIVDQYYEPHHRETLRLRPGLASPGSLYSYTHGEQMLDGSDPEKCYVERLLPVKLALDIVYVRNASWHYDLRIILRTVWTILAAALGRRDFPDPPELRKAEESKLIHLYS